MPTVPNLPELLAPAGSPEAAYAAFRYGADAIYCGLRRFSARAEAVNFDVDELREAIAYAHGLARPRKVYVTLNTLTTTDELADAAETLVQLSEAGADAVILQDAGVARLARRLVPGLERHASTQMAIHNLAGARAAAAMGFAQVTLARELTFDEVRAITAAGVRTEVFIHGALCYSYSGLCLLSSHRAGRSGNRGRCAYPCRERYRLEGTDAEGLAFSMKDLALGADVRALAAAGVHSLKIEGRMKGALYVAAVTDFYRRILDGKLTREADLRAAEEDLQTVFSRPWTTLYAHGAKRRDVVDPDKTGNRGVVVGTVGTVTREADGTRWLEFRTTRALELHDGLQFDLPGDARPYGFAIERFGGPERSPVLGRPAGTTVWIALPPDAPRLVAGTPVCCTSSQAVKQRFPTPLPPPSERKPRRPVDLRVRIESGRMTAEASLVGDRVAVVASLEGEYAPAKDADRTRAAIDEAFRKLGETGFVARSVEIANPEGRFAPMSKLNALRRELCERLAVACADDLALRIAAARAEASGSPVVAGCPTVGGAPAADGPAVDERWILRTDDAACVAEIDDADEVVLDIGSVPDADIERITERFGSDRVRLGLPVIARAWESAALAGRIGALRARGFRKWLYPSLGAWDLAAQGSASGLEPSRAQSGDLREWVQSGDDVATDWTLASMNPHAVAAWLEAGASGVTLSPEDGRDNLLALLRQWGHRATVVLYQDTPLMISEACPKNALRGGCDACRGQDALGRDEAPSEFRPSRGGDGLLTVLRGCRATVLGDRAYAIAEHRNALRGAGGRSWRVDFALRRYEPEEAAAIWRDVRAGRTLRNTHVGNWSRGI